jgi:polyhydroxyalkanoate synthesis regulator phasin
MEIDKLRQRLRNIGRNVTEYRMTVAEAQALVKEFAALEKEFDDLENKSKQVIINEPVTVIRIMDGGTF